ncbi:MAG: phosphopentomutase [Clostridia bacterium]|nr:phosphopentomutase [Clostridia bacterium]
MKRVFIIVLDSLGCGEEPDAALFGDKDCNTLKRISGSPKFVFNNLKKMGMGNIDGCCYLPGEDKPMASVARLRERSMGKDTTIGHWEIAGIVSESPLPTYPEGFPQDVLDEFTRLTGRGVLCNKPYSGTEVIKDYGEEHIKTGKLIVYTSADSVFQIAAHEDYVPIEQLYEYCHIAREMLKGKNGVGRVIARPFVGSYPNFTRTTRRHDYSLDPPGETLLDAVKASGQTVYAVGKIKDIFNGRGVSEYVLTSGNQDGMDKSLAAMDKDFEGLCFINLVDMDMLFGHRQDIDGYANSFAEFDARLPEFLAKMRDDDILFITADHGCDPGDYHTDHTREYVPLMVYGKNIKAVNLGTRLGFCDIATTAAEYLGVEFRGAGTSFLKDILRPTEDEVRAAKAAIAASDMAYVPYSKFHVGAALITASGKLYSGCNIENASYPVTNCAERTALFKAVSEGEKEFKLLAVYGHKEGCPADLCPPCGACRQALSEFCESSMPVIIVRDENDFVRTTIGELLPYSFSSADMEPKKVR